MAMNKKILYGFLGILLMAVYIIPTQSSSLAFSDQDWRAGQISAFQLRWPDKEAMKPQLKFNAWGGIDMDLPYHIETIRCCNPCQQPHAWCNVSVTHPDCIRF